MKKKTPIEPVPVVPELSINVRDTKESSQRIYVKDKQDPVMGRFSFLIDITALTSDIYIPLSVASGKKPAGFVYQIEGTLPGSIVTTDISCKGDGITQITTGTIVYTKIPLGQTANFRVHIEMRGKLSKEYRIVIYQLNYKRNPLDTRYEKTLQDIRSKMIKFN